MEDFPQTPAEPTGEPVSLPDPVQSDAPAPELPPQPPQEEEAASPALPGQPEAVPAEPEAAPQKTIAQILEDFVSEAPPQEDPTDMSEIDSMLARDPGAPPPPPPLPPQSPAEDRAPFSQYEEAAEEIPPRHTALRVLAFLFAFLVLAFAVFCIIWDLKKGTSSGGYRAGDSVHVEIVQQAHPASDAAEADENGRYTTEGIAECIMPSIVEIYTYTDGKMAGSGSGIILSEDGYIATNAHVVADADAFAVRFFNGSEDDDKQVDAALIGHDTKTDLAVIKVAVSGLKPATFGDSDQMKLGEAVCALGNPAGLSGSISTGIISGKNRKVRASSNNFEMECFQTDAAISPGNSGGALVNMYGQVIGITSSKYAASVMFGGTAYEGLGFAITVNEALPILKELLEQGYVSGRVRVGISFIEHDNAIAELTAQAEAEGKTFIVPKELEKIGVYVKTVDPDSDINNTIFEPGDWILTMNGYEVTDYDSLSGALSGCVGGDSVHCRCGKIQEDGTLKTYEIDFRLLEDQSGEY